MSITKYQIIKLKKDNFNIWFYSISNVFQAEKIDHLLNASQDDSITNTNVASQEGLGKSIIQQSLEPSDLSLILTFKTCKEIVDFFKSKSNRTVTKQNLNAEFVNLSWSRTESADDFVAKLTNLQLRMTDAGIQYDQSRFAHKLIDSLPGFLNDVQKDYEREDAKGIELKYDEIKPAILRLYDDRLKKNEIKKAMIVKRKNKSGLYCTYCHMTNHTIDKCFKRQRRNQSSQNSDNQASQQSSNNQQRNQACSSNQRNLNQRNSNNVNNSTNHNQSNTSNTNQPQQSLSNPPSTSNQHRNDDIIVPDQFKKLNCLSTNPAKWEFDTDCAFHMTNDLEHFDGIELKDGDCFITGNGLTQSKGVGRIKIKSFNGINWIDLYLNDVHYVPTIPNPLFSEPACKPVMQSDPDLGELKLLFNGHVLFTGNRNPAINNVPYVMNIKVIANSKCNLIKVNSQLLHKRMGHCPLPIIKKTIESNLVKEVAITEAPSDTCEDCLEFKMVRKPNNHQLIKTNEVGSVIHCDSYSPRIKTINGLNTAIVFVDEATRYINVQLIKDKSKASSAFNKYLAFQKEKIKKLPNRFHSDCGKELKNAKVTELLDQLQIRQSFSVPYVKQENGLAESTIKHLLFTTNSILNAAKLPKSLWNEVFQAAAYLINIRFKNSINSSPYVLFHGTIPPINHLRVIGTYAYVHIPLEMQSTFGPKSIKMRMVNYTESDCIYRFWHPGTKTIREFHDFSFLDENIKKTNSNQSSNQCKEQIQPHPNSNQQNDYATFEIEHHDHSLPDNFNTLPDVFSDDGPHSNGDSDYNEDDSNSPDHDTNQDNQEIQQPQPRKYTRKVYQRVQRDLRPRILNCMNLSKVDESVWRSAERKEIQSLIKNKTWDLEFPPPNQKIIKCGFIYATKIDPITSQTIYKARLCAKGYQQRFGIDYLDTYAPTMSIITVKIILIISIKYNLEIQQFDVSTAFLNSPLKETLWMDQPIDDGTGRKCKLNKSIYGLKQSASNWNETITSTLVSFGFTRTHSDKCLFIYSDSNDYMIVGIYVDDGIICANNKQLIANFFEFLQEKFEIKFGNLNKFIGIEIEFVNDAVVIHQHNYINKIKTTYLKGDLKPAYTPLPVNFKVDANQPHCEEIEHQFRSLICSLLYLSRLTRPDIAYSVGVLSTKLNKPSISDLASAIRILRYVITTKKPKASSIQDHKCIIQWVCRCEFWS